MSFAPQPVGFVNTALPDVVELRDVGLTYDGGKTWTIKGLNLLIEDVPGRGQFVVILGLSGCGKSTLLRFIAGLQRPTEGAVLLNGALPSHDHPATSMVFQQYSSLPCYTVLENVGLPLLYQGVPLKERNERAMEMIQLVGLDGHQGKWAKAPALSGGQLQRVAIARSLVANPRIILMDEPFGALDTKTRLEMQMLVYRISQQFQPTIIFVTHDISEAVFLANDIFVMRANPGQIEGYFPVTLQFERNQHAKQQPDFVRLVTEIEAHMMALA